MIGAFFVDQDVDGLVGQVFLGELLEGGFVVALVGGFGGLDDEGVEVFEDEGAGGVQACVEVDGGDDGFEGGGGDGAGDGGAGGHAFAHAEGVGEAEGFADFGAGSAGDDGGFDLGHFAFEQVGKAVVEVLADDHAQDGVAEELHAFVGVDALLGE